MSYRYEHTQYSNLWGTCDLLLRRLVPMCASVFSSEHLDHVGVINLPYIHYSSSRATSQFLLAIFLVD